MPCPWQVRHINAPASAAAAQNGTSRRRLQAVVGLLIRGLQWPHDVSNAATSSGSIGLPVEERADVAAELLASLDGGGEAPAEVEAAWASEIERRARRALAGGPPGAPWQDVRNRAESDLRQR